MGLKDNYKKLVEQALQTYHHKEVGEYKLYFIKKNSGYSGLYAKKKNEKLIYLTADPDKVEKKIKEKLSS